MFACWNTPKNVVTSTNTAIASGETPTSVSVTVLTSVQPTTSSGLNQNALGTSSRSALWCIW